MRAAISIGVGAILAVLGGFGAYRVIVDMRVASTPLFDAVRPVSWGEAMASNEGHEFIAALSADLLNRADRDCVARNGFTKSSFDALALNLTQFYLSRQMPDAVSAGQLRAALSFAKTQSNEHLDGEALSKIAAEPEARDHIAETRDFEVAMVFFATSGHVSGAFEHHGVVLSSFADTISAAFSGKAQMPRQPSPPPELVPLRQLRGIVGAYIAGNPGWWFRMTDRYLQWKGSPAAAAVRSHCLRVDLEAREAARKPFASVRDSLPAR